jgi:arylsulfatase A-like enzyme
MNKLLSLCLFSAVMLLAATCAFAAPPNIVLIFADDLGWQDVGFAGADYCESPNLDRLARGGMIFRHAYSTAGNCAPSRACLISGQYTPRHHVYAVGSTNRGPQNQMRMTPVPNKLTLPPDTLTLAEAMKSAGYATGMFGKCHLNTAQGGKSERTGFDVVKVSQGGLNSDDPADPKAIFSITNAACEFIEANRERPFFAYVSHYAVHSQLQARAETLERFRKQAPEGKSGDALYAACLADLDDGVGQLLAKLDELKLSDNTLVVFTTDNGGTGRSQEPLRGNKGSYHEGGIRVPMAVRWPGVVQAGSSCDVPVINVDLFPTFLAAAGAKVHEGKVLDGESLLPLLKGEGQLARKSIFWHFPGYLDNPVTRGRDRVFRTRPVTVINQDRWKLYLYHEEWQLDGGREKLATSNAVELYNLREDVGERENLALSNPAKRDQLLDDLLAWLAAIKAPLPTERNAAYDPDAKPAGGQRRRNNRTPPSP